MKNFQLLGTILALVSLKVFAGECDYYAQSDNVDTRFNMSISYPVNLNLVGVPQAGQLIYYDVKDESGNVLTPKTRIATKNITIPLSINLNNITHQGVVPDKSLLLTIYGVLVKTMDKQGNEVANSAAISFHIDQINKISVKVIDAWPDDYKGGFDYGCNVAQRFFGFVYPRIRSVASPSINTSLVRGDSSEGFKWITSEQMFPGDEVGDYHIYYNGYYHDDPRQYGHEMLYSPNTTIYNVVFDSTSKRPYGPVGSWYETFSKEIRVNISVPYVLNNFIVNTYSVSRHVSCGRSYSGYSTGLPSAHRS